MITIQDIYSAAFNESYAAAEIIAPANSAEYKRLENALIKQSGKEKTFDAIIPMMKEWQKGAMNGMFKAAEEKLMAQFPEMAE